MMPDHDVWFDEGIKADKTDAMLAVIAQTFARPTSILIVGCGSGREAGLVAPAAVADPRFRVADA